MKVLRFLISTLLLFFFLFSTARAQLLKITFEAENFTALDEGDSFYGWGGSKVSFAETNLEAEELLLLKKDGKIIARGDVKMSKPGLGVFAEEMVIDFYSGYFEMRNASGYFTVETAPNELFYFSGEELKGYPNRFIARKAYITSCSFDCPQEYHIQGSKAVVKPGKSMEVWNASGWVGSIPILYLPYMFIDLTERNSRWQALVGKNKVEGKFLKSSYTYAMRPSFIGILFFDWLEKKGTRYAIQDTYRVRRFGDQVGSFSYSTNKEKLTKRRNEVWSLKQGFLKGKLKSDVSMSRNATYSTAGPRTDNFTSSFSFSGINPTFNFGYNKTGGASKSSNLTGKMGDTRKIFGLSSQLTLDYGGNKTGGKATNQELRLNQTFTVKPGKLFSNFTISTAKRWDLDGSKFTGDPFTGADKFPEIKFSLNPKLFQDSFWKSLLLLSAVNFTFSAQKTQTSTRQVKSLVLGETELSQQINIKFSKSLGLSLNHRFTQGIYGTGDAKYGVQPNATLRWDHSKTFHSSFNYVYSREHGNNPIRGGALGGQNNLTYNLDAGRSPKWSLRLGTGFNYNNNKFSPITFSYNQKPSRNFNLNLASGYDLENNKFQDLTVKQTLDKKQGWLYWDVGWTYSIEDSKFRRIDSILKINLWGGYNIQAKGSWAKSDKLPFIKEVILNKQNCCTFYQLAYNAQKKEIFFNWGITAFPQYFIGLSHGDEGLLFTHIPGREFVEKGVGGTPTTGAGTGGSYGGGGY